MSSSELTAAKTGTNPSRSIAVPMKGVARKVSASTSEKRRVTAPSASPFASSCSPIVPTVNWHWSALMLKSATTSLNSAERACAPGHAACAALGRRSDGGGAEGASEGEGGAAGRLV